MRKRKKTEPTSAAEAVLTEVERARQENEAIRRIATNARAVEEIEGDLALIRHQWNELVATRRVSLKATIESSGGALDADAKHRLDAILVAQQDVEEAEAGRKVALADVLTRKKQARKALRESFDNARQLELDVSPLPPELSEDLTESHAPPIG